MKQDLLEKAYYVLENTTLPRPTGIESLDDLIFDLLELDACVAGLTYSGMKNCKISRKDIPNLKNIEKNLLKLKKNKHIDKEIVDEVEVYLNIIKGVCKLLKDVSS